ncbi:hypothetical protein [Streptomyces sp. NPDC002187]|uniref:hypothetical protein n=1 Tax=Streptomyces sp. NPDC002187 TaxID=3364637 RepID=UPI0036B63F7B
MSARRIGPASHPYARRAAPQARAAYCRARLHAAPLPLHGAGPGTPVGTCDAVGACLTLPRFRWVLEVLACGNTLRKPLGKQLCALLGLRPGG